jgi:hypothetical protein
MKLTRSAFAFFVVFALIFAAAKTDAQLLPRTFGARAFSLDDGTGSGKTLTWDVTSPLILSYHLHFPATSPANTVNFLISDASGNMSWATSSLPQLAPGNIWYGNPSSIATPLAPTVPGAILSLNNSLLPIWITALPLAMTISATQITSGTLPPGTTIGVGPGATIQPTGGTVNANFLSGTGFGKYSGKILITTGASHLDSSVTVSVFDPQAMTFGFVEAQVSQITPGVGFRVIFSADYPNSGTGELHYTVINP